MKMVRYMDILRQYGEMCNRHYSKLTCILKLFFYLAPPNLSYSVEYTIIHEINNLIINYNIKSVQNLLYSTL
jgi:hypothetical protein